MQKRRFIGARIPAPRAAQASPRAAMARRVGISVSCLSQIENGDRPVALAVLAAAFPADWVAPTRTARRA